MSHIPSLVTIDVGNSRIKLGRFVLPVEGGGEAWVGLPEPVGTFTLAPPDQDEPFDFAPLGDWLSAHVPKGSPMIVGSVSRPRAALLRTFLKELDGGNWDALQEFTTTDMPIENRTHLPERVGVDRLAAAVAANAIRRRSTPAIVIDFGTAITVDLVASDGGFEGGAILPGVGLGAAALHQRTDALPRVEPRLDAKSPPAIGKSTEAALHAGLYWGTVGAVRELIARQSDSLTTPPQVLVTGSVAPEMARLLGSPDYTVRYLPHLVLAGLAIAAR